MPEPPEVALPEALINLAVFEHHDVVVEDDEGWVRGWWVPDEDGLPEFFLPLDASLQQDVPLPAIAGLDGGDRSLLGVVVSHGHPDRYGLAVRVHASVLTRESA